MSVSHTDNTCYARNRNQNESQTYTDLVWTTRLLMWPNQKREGSDTVVELSPRLSSLPWLPRGNYWSSRFQSISCWVLLLSLILIGIKRHRGWDGILNAMNVCGLTYLFIREWGSGKGDLGGGGGPSVAQLRTPFLCFIETKKKRQWPGLLKKPNLILFSLHIIKTFKCRVAWSNACMLRMLTGLVPMHLGLRFHNSCLPVS